MTFARGDRVAIIGATWCKGTVVGPDPPKGSGQVKVRFDDTDAAVLWDTVDLVLISPSTGQNKLPAGFGPSTVGVEPGRRGAVSDGGA